MERVPAGSLHGRLRALGAVYQADRSSAAAHIYYSAPSRRWIKVTRDRDPNVMRLEFHATCPCSKA